MMTKKEIIKQWLDEPKVRYCNNSNFTLGYGFREIEEFLKSKTGKPSEEDCSLYSVGYKDGVNDAMIAIKNRFENLK